MDKGEPIRVIYLDFQKGASPKAISTSRHGTWVLKDQLTEVNADEDAYIFPVPVTHTVDDVNPVEQFLSPLKR